MLNHEEDKQKWRRWFTGWLIELRQGFYYSLIIGVTVKAALNYHICLAASDFPMEYTLSSSLGYGVVQVEKKTQDAVKKRECFFIKLLHNTLNFLGRVWHWKMGVPLINRMSSPQLIAYCEKTTLFMISLIGSKINLWLDHLPACLNCLILWVPGTWLI